MTVTVAVHKEHVDGWIVTCTACGRVARRELELDAQAKAERHADDHRLHGQQVEIAA